jgi:hypothetical protein
MRVEVQKLRPALEVLSQEQLQRIRRHLQAGVKLLLGEEWQLFVDGQGGACLAAMAFYDVIPTDFRTGAVIRLKDGEKLWKLYAEMSQPGHYFEAALEDLKDPNDPKEVLELVEEILKERG